ncbi:MAG: hypothetical protein RR361_02790 [Anaerovorax sp.]
MNLTEQVKERNYLFDTFRGLLIWCIPISHFTRVGGDFTQGSLSGIVYITINVFVMQAFVFLSGYFSKKPERARETAFKTFLFPYLLFTVFFYFVRYGLFGNANLNFVVPPFALWYLLSLFFYRFFLRDIVKIKHVLLLSILLYLVAGQVPAFDETLGLGRMVSYFPFFMVGYYCTKEGIEKIQKMRLWQTLILGVVLVGISCTLAFFVDVPVGFYLLKGTAASLGMVWYVDILMRAAVFCIAIGWIILMFNILPKGKNYVSYVGQNTMPIYIFHLIIRYIIKIYGLYAGNVVIYYLLVFGLASLCVVVLSSPPVVKLYDLFVDSLYNLYLKLKKLVLVKE